MNEILKSAGEGIKEGLREAPREFVVPFTLLWRGVKNFNHVLNTALAEARASARSSTTRSHK